MSTSTPHSPVPRRLSPYSRLLAPESPSQAHIRTPSPSHSSESSTSPHRRPMPPYSSRLPRPMTRILLVLGLVLTSTFLINAARPGVSSDEGQWDASSYSDRSRRALFGRREMSSSDMSGSHGLSPSDGLRLSYNPAQRPVRATAPRRVRPTHPGVSRVRAADILDREYEESPLPSLEEAFAHLEPILRSVKEETPGVPVEHMLWNPIFPPFLPEHLKERYRHVRDQWDDRTLKWQPAERRWYMVTVCRQVAGMLADWFAAWTVLADFVGPESLVFTLLEGSSDDASGAILSAAMRDHLLYLGVPPANIQIRTGLPTVDWENVHRIETLAEMRNAGMQPFYDAAIPGTAPDGVPYTGIIYYNDVYLSATHFLELMHYHLKHDAGMTCAWDHAGKWFYDGWVGRDMSGDLYTPFPLGDEQRDKPQVEFPSHPATNERFKRLLPFQVFAGWNGIAVMSPQPFLPPYNVRFRRGARPPGPPGETNLTAADMECQASESSFISWDFWKYGFSRIQVVPGVHVTYGKEDAVLRGWVEWPQTEVGWSDDFTWTDEPPAKIRCHDWPDKPGKGWWAWDTVRWVDAPPFVPLDKGSGPV